MCKKAAFLFFLLISAYGFAQQPGFVHHVVKKGETLYSISRKYGLTPYDILRENPQLEVDDLAIGTLIEIPLEHTQLREASPSASQGNSTFFYHTVKRGETLAALKRLYGVNLQLLKRWNPDWSKGLAIGQRLKIPRLGTPSPRETAPLTDPVLQDGASAAVARPFDSDFYLVKPHETLYALHQRFGVSIRALRDWNGGLPEGLKAGMRLRIRAPRSVSSRADKTLEPTLPAQQVDSQRDTLTFAHYTVQRGQTLFGILRQTQISFKELLQYNSALREGLAVGMLLRIPQSVTLSTPELDFERNTLDFGSKTQLRDSIGARDRLNVVLLAPFYTLQSDTTAVSDSLASLDTTAAPKSAFATAFAVGARLALDSLRQKGLHIRFSLFDTHRDVRELQDLLAAQSLGGTDLVIGPFYTDLSERAAQLLDSIPVVSPFSQRLDLSAHPNLIQVRAPKAFMEQEVLDQLLRESQLTDEILVLCTPSPHCDRVVDYLEKRTVSPLERMLELPDDSTLYDLKDRQLQVVFPDETNSTYAEDLYKLAEINAGFNIKAYFTQGVNYYSAMPVRDVINLQLTLPKATYHNRNKASYKVLEEKFTRRYQMGPRVYELMGYDITYDFLLRLSQHSDLYSSLQTQRSEDIQLLTDFRRLKTGGYFNGGFFLLRCGEDGWKPINPPREALKPPQLLP